MLRFKFDRLFQFELVLGAKYAYEEEKNRMKGREREGGNARVLSKLLDVATVVSAITPTKSQPIKSRLSASWLSSSLCLPFLLSLAPALVLFLLPRGRSSLPPWVTHPPYLGHNPPANRIPLVKLEYISALIESVNSCHGRSARINFVRR